MAFAQSWNDLNSLHKIMTPLSQVRWRHFIVKKRPDIKNDIKPAEIASSNSPPPPPLRKEKNKGKRERKNEPMKEQKNG